jgi:hypothetical protein
MKDLAMRNRRTAVLTFAGIGFLHLVATGVVMLLLSAGRAEADRNIPQRPALRLDELPMAVGQQDVVASGSPPMHGVLESHWTARHKDAAAPWTLDAEGRIRWH